VPSASVPTGAGALVWFAGTVTVEGTVTIPLGVALTVRRVAFGWAADIVTVSVVVAPSVTGFAGGRSDTTVGCAGVTVTVLLALVPLRLVVICAVPGVFALTEIDALVWPAGTVTVLGTKAMPDAVLFSDTVVVVSCAALIVTVKTPEPPCVIVSVPGVRLVTVGGWGLTCTVLVAVPPFADTVIMAFPALTALTGTGTLLCPLAKETEAGTVATPVFELVTLSVPAAVGVGDNVAVRVPVAPTVMVKGLGVSVVGVGRILVPRRLIVKVPPLGSLIVTCKVFVAWSVTVRSITVTFGVKSVLRTICTPFRTTVAAVTRCAPVASPFTKWKRKGGPIDGGTAKESVTVTGCPVARTYCLGPKSSWSGVAWEERGRGRISPPTRRARTQAERIHR